MKIRISDSVDRLPEMDLDYLMGEPQDTIQFEMHREREPVSGLPLSTNRRELQVIEVWEYRLDGYLPWAPGVPRYRFARVATQ
jgi:hypothetical protein